MRRLGRLVAVAGVAIIAACASDPRDRPTPIRAENVFMSPSGEPFHAGLDEPYAAAKWFAQADADHDGRITRAEFQADAERAFRRFDINGDGVIDGIETAAYEDRIAPEILPRIAALSAGEGMAGTLLGGRGRGLDDRPRRTRKPRAGDRALQGAGLFGYLDEPEPITAADADLNGKVTLAEWRRRTDVRFDLIRGDAETLQLSTLPKTTMQTLLERRAAAEAKRRP